MDTTIAIYYQGAIAEYGMAIQPNGTFKARLLQYKGIQGKMPPESLELQYAAYSTSKLYTYQNLLEELDRTLHKTIVIH